MPGTMGAASVEVRSRREQVNQVKMSKHSAISANQGPQGLCHMCQWREAIRNQKVFIKTHIKNSKMKTIEEENEVDNDR